MISPVPLQTEPVAERQTKPPAATDMLPQVNNTALPPAQVQAETPLEVQTAPALQNTAEPAFRKHKESPLQTQREPMVQQQTDTPAQIHISPSQSQRDKPVQTEALPPDRFMLARIMPGSFLPPAHSFVQRPRETAKDMSTPTEIPPPSNLRQGQGPSTEVSEDQASGSNDWDHPDSACKSMGNVLLDLKDLSLKETQMNEGRPLFDGYHNPSSAMPSFSPQSGPSTVVIQDSQHPVQPAVGFAPPTQQDAQVASHGQGRSQTTLPLVEWYIADRKAKRNAATPPRPSISIPQLSFSRPVKHPEPNDHVQGQPPVQVRDTSSVRRRHEGNEQGHGRRGDGDDEAELRLLDRWVRKSGKQERERNS
ncbi:hypothetical protein ACHAPA_012323 [Fusarium lateritium]